MQNKHKGGINIGTSSVLVIFVLLALVTFASLSYLSAKSDYTLSKEAADRTASYYDANRMAEIYMANIEGLLSKHYATCSGEEDYYNGIESLFADNDNIIVSGNGSDVKLDYSVAVTEGQNLEVSFKIHYPTNDDTNLFYIHKWATCVNRQWLDNVKENNSKDSGVKLLFQ